MVSPKIIMPGVNFNRCGAAADIKVLDCGAQQTYCTDGQQSSDEDAGKSADESKAGGFAQKRAKHIRSAGAKSAHDSNLGAAAHHRHRDGVEDQERSDHQSDVAKNAQVPAKRA